MYVIVPVKSFAHAKTRLGVIFDAGMRRQLARTMAKGLLQEMVRVRELRRILVVSSEPEMAALCRETGTDYLWDDGAGGLNGALSFAERQLPVDRCGGVAVVSADLPFFRAAEFEKMLAAHAELGPAGLTLAADYHGRGTNARIVSAAGGMAYRFGEDSAAAHLREADRLGLPHLVFRSETLALDLDTPDNAIEMLRLSMCLRDPQPGITAVLRTGLDQHLGERRTWMQ